MPAIPGAASPLPEEAAAMTREVARTAFREPGRAPGGEAPEALEALATLHRLRELLSDWEPRLIEEARAAGTSWAHLAPYLGVTTRQAAERRYLRLRADPGEPSTNREGRVRAARDERAGDRAVAGWARDHAAHLRQVAGQASALRGLGGGAARSRAQDLRDSLDGDDPAALLEPLQAMHQHLAEDHGALADQVRAIARQVGRVRRDTQRDRDRGREADGGPPR